MAQRDARIKIINDLRSDKLKEIYNFGIRVSDEQIKLCIEEPGADLLDSILCAIQAGWAYTQKNNHYGIPAECDPLEGWIVDPAMEQKGSLFPFFGDSARNSKIKTYYQECLDDSGGRIEGGQTLPLGSLG